MEKEISYGSVKRFGTRYGRTLKHRVGEIEADQRKKHKCPFCHNMRVKRVSVGIWQCGKCNAKFTGKAYTIEKKKIPLTIEEHEELLEEEQPEEFEEEKEVVEEIKKKVKQKEEAEVQDE